MPDSEKADFIAEKVQALNATIEAIGEKERVESEKEVEEERLM